jgi:hypothetical protein
VPQFARRLSLLSIMMLLLGLLWPQVTRAQPSAQWIGVWVNGEEHTTLTLTGSTLSLAWPDAAAPERYDWTERRYGTPADLAKWGYEPGYYFAFDQTTTTAAAIRAALAAAWAPRLALDPDNRAAAARYATLRGRVERIHAGSYRRIRRFCIADRRAKIDCLAATRNEFFIADGDHLVLVLIVPSAPDTSNVLFFTRAGGGGAAQARR